MAKKGGTNIEIKLQFILQELGFSFRREFRIGNYPVDFYLKDYDLSINVDGCWVHGCKTCTINDKRVYPRQIFQRRRDKACVMYHKYSKINILRLKECTLNDVCTTKLIITSTIDKIKLGDKVYDCR